MGPLPSTAVMNGIAYNHDQGTFFVTGKNWPTLFEVKLPALA
jgi:glutamine cyclotransferase